MQAAAGLADVRRQARLERRVHVFVVERDLPLAGIEGGLEFVEPVADRVTVGGVDQARFREHLDMCDRTSYVVGNEPRIEPVILARRIPQYALVERQTLVPQACHVAPPPCSAGVSAAMSLTTSVPVPSLVKTSSSRLSGAL